MGIATGSLVALMFRLSGVFFWGFMGVLTARTLTVEDRGVYASAIVLTAAIGGISSLSHATGFFVSNQRREPAEVAANAVTMALPVAFAAMLIGVVLYAFAGSSDGRVVALAAISLAPAVIRNTSLGVLIGQNSILKYNLAGDTPILLATAFLGIWLGVLDHRSAESAMQAWCVAQYFSLLPIVYWGRDWWRWALRHSPNRELMTAMLKFTSVTGVGSIVGLLSGRIDQALVISLDGKEGAGIYSSAIAVAEGLFLFSTAVSLASFARVGRSDRAEAAHIVATGVRHTVLVVIGLGLSAALIGPSAIEFLFGHAYRGASEPMRILCLGTAIAAPQGLISLYFVNQLGMPRFPLLLGILSLAASLALGFALIPPFGTSGAAWATTASFSLTSSTAVVFFLRRTRIPFSELWRVRTSDIRAYFTLARTVLQRALGVGRAALRAVLPVRA